MEILLIPHKCEKLDKGNFDSVLQIPKELNLIKHSSHKKGGKYGEQGDNNNRQYNTD